ncbi:MAG TPA: cupin domain-containing protein, partial [Burkholderiales bacterium]|nr:cupin domain-containing protein [Burkholderiales bacterium]
MRNRYEELPVFVTKDGSLVRELMHPRSHCNGAQSLAEAVVGIGMTTALHRHVSSEELYHVTMGSGEMMLGDKLFEVSEGDTICILPGTPHRIRNTGEVELRIL